jgi:serpin B
VRSTSSFPQTRVASTLAACALVLACSATSPARAAVPTNPDELLLEDNRDFAVDLYRRLAAAPDNLFFSPWSIRTALGMVYAGARGRTERQMAFALDDRLGQSRLHRATSRLERELRTTASGRPSETELLTANAVWAAGDMHLDPAFADTLELLYAAPPTAIDFASGGAARATINAWVEEKTRGRVRDLIPPDALGPETRLVVCDAIYLKAPWLHEFPASATAAGTFHGSDRNSVTVSFMLSDQVLRYSDNSHVQVLELPYGGDLVMPIFLPRDVAGLSAIERELDSDWLTGWVSRVEETFVRLSMPKFRIEDQLKLSGPLSAMGMGDAFTQGADFSGIAPERPLFISEVYHKSFVTVDEQGTEAAAAAAIVHTKGTISMPPRRVTFTADHPFMFLIRDRKSGTILFMGRLANPN